MMMLLRLRVSLMVAPGRYGRRLQRGERSLADQVFLPINPGVKMALYDDHAICADIL